MNLIILLCTTERFPEARAHLEFLAQQGANVEVAANDGRMRIVIDGRLLYEGNYTSLE